MLKHRTDIAAEIVIWIFLPFAFDRDDVNHIFNPLNGFFVTCKRKWFNNPTAGFDHVESDLIRVTSVFLMNVLGVDVKLLPIQTDFIFHGGFGLCFMVDDDHLSAVCIAKDQIADADEGMSGNIELEFILCGHNLILIAKPVKRSEVIDALLIGFLSVIPGLRGREIVCDKNRISAFVFLRQFLCQKISFCIVLQQFMTKGSIFRKRIVVLRERGVLQLG